jgi:hypothetical protein
MNRGKYVSTNLTFGREEMMMLEKLPERMAKKTKKKRRKRKRKSAFKWREDCVGIVGFPYHSVH